MVFYRVSGTFTVNPDDHFAGLVSTVTVAMGVALDAFRAALDPLVLGQLPAAVAYATCCRRGKLGSGALRCLACHVRLAIGEGLAARRTVQDPRVGAGNS